MEEEKLLICVKRNVFNYCGNYLHKDQTFPADTGQRLVNNVPASDATPVSDPTEA
jgi:hypothetical protein